MELNYNSNKVLYSYNNFYKILPCLHIEYARNKIITQINKDIKNKFPQFKKNIYSILIEKQKKKYDPILDYVEYSDTNSLEITKYINTKIKIAIEKISKLKYKNEKVKKKISNEIILIYKDSEIKIQSGIYKRIKSNILDNSFEYFCNFDTLLWMIYSRYIKMQLYNNSQGATTEEHYKKLQKKFGSEIEGFGSIFNHTLRYYFGLFPDLEQFFGCLGNFFNSKIIKGFFLVNPPFTVLVINNTINHILEQLDNTKENLTFLLVIPAWDNLDRAKLNEKCKLKLQITNYEEKLELDKCKNSKYLRKYYLYCKDKYKYYNFLLDKVSYFSATNIILLSNTNKEYNIENIFGKPTIKVNE